MAWWLSASFITFCVSHRRRKMYCGHVQSVCLSVCVSAAVRPHYCTDPDVTWWHGRGCPPSCTLLGGFAIGALVALLWQHNANPSYKLASIPRYDDIVRTAGWAGSARATGRRPAGDGGRSQHYCGSLECGLSTGGVLATKSERKMLASTCLYSLYALLHVLYEHRRTKSLLGSPVHLHLNKYGALYVFYLLIYCMCLILYWPHTVRRCYTVAHACKSAATSDIVMRCRSLASKCGTCSITLNA